MLPVAILEFMPVTTFKTMVAILEFIPVALLDLMTHSSQADVCGASQTYLEPNVNAGLVEVAVGPSYWPGPGVGSWSESLVRCLPLMVNAGPTIGVAMAGGSWKGLTALGRKVGVCSTGVLRLGLHSQDAEAPTALARQHSGGGSSYALQEGDQLQSTLSACLSICQSVCQSISLSVCQSVSRSICQSVCLSVSYLIAPAAVEEVEVYAPGPGLSDLGRRAESGFPGMLKAGPPMLWRENSQGAAVRGCGRAVLEKYC